jgi:trigger factor
VKSAVETLSPTRVKLTVEVPFDEVKPNLDKVYRQLAQQINVPGFRRGKVPPMVIDRQVGREAVLEQAVADTLPAKYSEAIEANDLTPIAQPEIEGPEINDDGFEFSAEVDVKPDFELPDYEGVTATVDDVEVTDADVEEQVQALRERFGTLSDVERPAADGDFVVLDLRATQDGEPVEGAEVSGMSYQVGRGGMIDGLDEALTGLSAGEERTFDSQLVGGDLVGQSVQVSVTVSQVQEQELPEVDDEFAELASEFDTVAEMDADIRERLARGKRLEQAAAARDAVLEALLDRVEIPLPESMVTDELNARRQNIEQQLAYAGVTMEKYLEDEGQTLEEFEADLERRTREAIAAQFLLDEVAKREEYDITQEELSQHLVRRAQQSGQDPQEFANHMFEHNHIPDLVREILRGKALATIVEAATVTDASGNPVELRNLRPDGTIGDPEAEGDDAADAAGGSTTYVAGGADESAESAESDESDESDEAAETDESEGGQQTS